MNMHRIPVRTVANILEISEQTIQSYIKKGLLHPDKIAKGKTFDLEEVMSLKEQKALHPERYHKQASPIE